MYSNGEVSTSNKYEQELWRVFAVQRKLRKGSSSRSSEESKETGRVSERISVRVVRHSVSAFHMTDVSAKAALAVGDVSCNKIMITSVFTPEFINWQLLQYGTPLTIGAAWHQLSTDNSDNQNEYDAHSHDEKVKKRFWNNHTIAMLNVMSSKSYCALELSAIKERKW